MSHATEGSLLAYLDGVLPSDTQQEFGQHLSGCDACSAELERLRDAQERFSAAMLECDVAAPLGLARLAVQRERWTQRARLARRWLARAAVLLVFTGAAAAAAIPGTPVHTWLVNLWRNAVIVVRGSAPRPAPVPSTSTPAAAEEATSSVSIQPLNGRVEVMVSQADASARIHVRLVGASLAAIEARGQAAAAHFRTGPGMVEVVGAAGGDIVVDIPRTVERALVRVNGRLVLEKQGDLVRTLVTPTDSSQDEMVFRPGG
jgi:anti-sigma factor RsiW